MGLFEVATLTRLWHIYVTDQWSGGMGVWVGPVSSGLPLGQMKCQSLPLEQLGAVGWWRPGTVQTCSRLE